MGAAPPPQKKNYGGGLGRGLHPLPRKKNYGGGEVWGGVCGAGCAPSPANF